jgi:hypothetical protein
MDLTNSGRVSLKVPSQRRVTQAHPASVRHKHLRVPQQRHQILQLLLEMNQSIFSRLLPRQAPNKLVVEPEAGRAWEAQVAKAEVI